MTTRSRGACTATALGAAALVVAAVPGFAAAQFVAGADASVGSRAVWRGLQRARGAAIEPAAYGGYTLRRVRLATGIWASVEAREVDYWAQATTRVWLVTTTVGATAYRFRGNVSDGRLSSDADTREMYLRAEFGLPGGFEGEVDRYWDRDRVGGRFTEYTMRRAIPLAPIREVPPTVVVTSTIGTSKDQSVGRSDGPLFARDGFRFADVSLAASYPFAWPRSSIGATVHRLWTRHDDPVVGGSPPAPDGWRASIDLSVAIDLAVRAGLRAIADRWPR